MINKVESDYLASFLILDKTLEPFPETYRGQSNLVFEISFIEYLDFIEFYLGKYDYLSTPTSLIKQNLRMFRQERLESSKVEIFRYFQKDIAFAIAKELHYCSLYNMEASNIIHYYAGGVDLGEVFIESMYKDVEVRSVESEFLSILKNKNYPISTISLSRHNLSEWKYSVVLYYLSEHSKLFWSFTGK